MTKKVLILSDQEFHTLQAALFTYFVHRDEMLEDIAIRTLATDGDRFEPFTQDQLADLNVNHFDKPDQTLHQIAATRLDCETPDLELDESDDPYEMSIDKAFENLHEVVTLARDAINP